LWISAAKPGRASELTAVRHDEIPAKLRAAGFGAIGDLGFTALDDDPDHPVTVVRLPLGHRERALAIPTTR
jgi:hypothetical protein